MLSRASSVSVIPLGIRLWIALGAAGWAATVTPMRGAGSDLPVDLSLPERLQRELGDPATAGVVWGAWVVRADGSPVFGTNTQHAFIPASNTKLFIGALALDRLGPEARLRTPVHVERPPDADGVLHSDLWVLGQGDPGFGSAPQAGAGASRRLWDQALEPWVARWQSRGLRRVEGDLVLCDAAVQVPDYGPGWDEEDRAEAYGAPVSAFVANDNTFKLVAPPIAPGASSVPFHSEPPQASWGVEWQVHPGTNAPHRIRYERRSPGGPVIVQGQIAPGPRGWSAELAVPDAPRAFGELLKHTLQRRGIAVSGSVRVVHATNGCPGLAWDHWDSEPLARRLALCLKPSQNLHAQLLLAEVGRRVEPTTPGPGASVRRHDLQGLSVLPGFLDRIGIAPESVHLEEGSGLCRSNRVTPAATVTLLRSMADGPRSDLWKSSLPVGGVEGTLIHRFKTGRAHRNVRAKTGSLRGVHALGGYVTTADGEELVFALYANQAQSDPQARARMDRFVEILASARTRPAHPASPAPAPR